MSKKISLPSLCMTIALPFCLAGCDAVQQKLGIEDTAAKLKQAEADAKAVGGACRQSGRALEDCYSVYSWLNKASIYEGWREMDVYMRENQLQVVEPQLPPIPAPLPSTESKKKKVASKKTSQ